MQDNLSVEGNQSLSAAQVVALKHQLPLAVVFCWVSRDDITVVPRLKKIEQQLSEYDIPLLTLVGASEKVLPGLFHHVQPVAVFTDDSPVHDLPPALVPHPVSWPGKVITVSELQALDALC